MLTILRTTVYSTVAFLSMIAAVPAHSIQVTHLLGEYKRADEPSIRIELLREISDLQDEEEEAPEVVPALIRGLKDDSFAVRAVAVELLAERDDSETAFQALLASANKAEDFKEEIQYALKKFEAKIPKPGDKDAVEMLERASDLLKEKAKIWEGVAEYNTALSTAILARRDDRCVEAIGSLLKMQLYGEDAFPLVDGLFALGTRPAVKEAIDLLPVLEKALKDREKPRKKLARERAQKVPKYWKGTKDSWAEREAGRLAGLLAAFDKRTAELEEWRSRYATLLAEASTKAGLASPPAVPEAKKWTRWWREAKMALPESLTGE